jgi:hypothetical protein
MRRQGIVYSGLAGPCLGARGGVPVIPAPSNGIRLCGPSSPLRSGPSGSARVSSCGYRHLAPSSAIRMQAGGPVRNEPSPGRSTTRSSAHPGTPESPVSGHCNSDGVTHSSPHHVASGSGPAWFACAPSPRERFSRGAVAGKLKSRRPGTVRSSGSVRRYLPDRHLSPLQFDHEHAYGRRLRQPLRPDPAQAG